MCVNHKFHSTWFFCDLLNAPTLGNKGHDRSDFDSVQS